MARHPQSSPRGLYSAKQIGIGTVFIDQVAAKPSTRSTRRLSILVNSTGVCSLMVNTTGTTWKYLNVTAKLPT